MMVPYALFLWMLTGSKQSDQFFLCHSDAYECMYIVAETQRNCECFEAKLSNTLCSLFYCYQQLCVFVHILDPRLSSPASIPLTYSPSLLFSSGKDASCVSHVYDEEELGSKSCWSCNEVQWQRESQPAESLQGRALSFVSCLLFSFSFQHWCCL